MRQRFVWLDESIPIGGNGTKQELSLAGRELVFLARVRYSVAMLSVLIETLDDEDALARTLGSLVGAAVEGVVREVIVCDGGSSDGTCRVAEHAGCSYLADALASNGAREARSEWLLLLEPGARLLDGWMEAVIAHAGSTTGPARFTPATRSRPPLVKRLFARRRPLADGLVITKNQALTCGAGEGTAAGIAAAVSALRLSAEIHVAAPGRTAKARPG